MSIAHKFISISTMPIVLNSVLGDLTIPSESEESEEEEEEAEEMETEAPSSEDEPEELQSFEDLRKEDQVS
jgi:hypothetical protein